MPVRLIDRRSFGIAAFGGVAIRFLPAEGRPSDRKYSAAGPSVTVRALSALEARHGGRLGIMAVDTGSGETVAYRADERFPMCSTHKVLVGAAILSMIEKGRLRADQRVAYGQADLLEYAPVTAKNVAAGFMTVDALCEAAIRWSDNTADNLLLKLLGGPEGWTRYARSVGDAVSRLDRFEPELNTSIPGDPRDTSSPSAMTDALATLLFGSVLGDISRMTLKRWMLDSPITGNLLRKDLPDGWHVADKSGSGSNGSRNDVGVIYPLRSAPIVISVFYTGSNASSVERDETIARCASLAAHQ